MGGLYIGVNAGRMSSDIDWTYNSGTRPDKISHNAGVLGGHVGIQHQINRFVIGVEGSWSGTGAFKGNDFAGGFCPNNAFRCVGRVNNFLTLGPRLGWTPFDNWLLFGTGGWAAGNIDTQTPRVTTGVLFDESHSSHHGWFAGGGVEYALNKNWLIGVEYQHINLDGKVALSSVLASENRSVGSDVDIVRARLTFKLGRPEEKHEEPLK